VENSRQAGIEIEAYVIDLVTHRQAHSIRCVDDWLHVPSGAPGGQRHHGLIVQQLEQDFLDVHLILDN
jgi:hypothetical protein